MPFGLRHAPEVCCRFSGVVLGILRRRLRLKGLRLGVDVQVSNVVDDWLVLASDRSVCRSVWEDLCSSGARVCAQRKESAGAVPRVKVAGPVDQFC